MGAPGTSQWRIFLLVYTFASQSRLLTYLLFSFSYFFTRTIHCAPVRLSCDSELQRSQQEAVMLWVVALGSSHHREASRGGDSGRPELASHQYHENRHTG